METEEGEQRMSTGEHEEDPETELPGRGSLQS